MIKNYLNFLREIEKLKTIERSNRTSNLDRGESDAEHIWHLTMMVYLFCEERPSLDKWKSVKLALVHDLVEVYAGDVQFWDQNKETLKEKEEKERQSAEKLFGLLPEKTREEFLNLWEEYERRNTDEAKFVYALDKLQPLLQRVQSKDHVWKEKKIDREKLVEYKNELISADIELSEIWGDLVDEAVKNDLFWK